MNTTAIVVIVIAVVVVAVIAVLAVRAAGARRALKERYGPEYDRAIDEHGGRSAAEAELRRRTKAHDELELRDLTPEETAHYRAAWTDLQGQFIDDPTAAVRAADQLVSKLVADRGYPVVEFDDRVAQLSVEHAGVLGSYRDGHAIAERSESGTASTEDLRRALVLYRGLIADLLGDATLNEPGVNASTFDETAVTAPAVTESGLTEPAVTESADTGAGRSGPTVVEPEVVEPSLGEAEIDETTGIDETASGTPSAVPTTIPTVDGKPPTAADLSANEGYVSTNVDHQLATDADQVDSPSAVVPDDARDLATDADDVAPVVATPTSGRRSRTSSRKASE